MAGRVAESEWAERQAWIVRQEESGLSAAQFCRENGLHEGNFHAWRLRFAKLKVQSHIGTGKAADRQGLRAFVQLPMPLVPSVAVAGPSWIEVSLVDGMEPLSRSSVLHVLSVTMAMQSFAVDAEADLKRGLNNDPSTAVRSGQLNC